MTGNDKEEFEITGILKNKEEGTSANGPFWKMMIDDKRLSLWEFELGEPIPEGAQVEATYTTTHKGDKTYHNIKTIKVADGNVAPATPAPATPSAPSVGEQRLNNFKSDEADKYAFGQALNNAATIVAGMMQRGAVWTDVKSNYWEIVNDLFEESKVVRKEKLGY